MSLLDDFQDIARQDEPLESYTYFRLGGPAEHFLQPRSIDELSKLIRRCAEQEIPVHILGGGCNILVPDEGVKGAVIKLDGPEFISVSVNKNLVDAAAGAPLSSAITMSTRQKLAGLDMLVGIPGTIGGSVRMNAGGREGDIGQSIRQVTIMDMSGEVSTRERDELEFNYRETNLDDCVILSAQFELEEDDPELIVKRMRKLWISKKASQPLGFESAGCVFKNPRGLSAGLLIEQAGLKGTTVGGAEVSERHANFIIANAGCTSRDVRRLIDLVQSKVAERFSVDLELELKIW